MRKKLVEAAQLGPRDLVLTQGNCFSIRRGVASGALAHLGGDAFGIDLALALGQTRLDDRLHALHGMLAQKLQNTSKLLLRRLADAFFQGMAQLCEAGSELPIA